MFVQQYNCESKKTFNFDKVYTYRCEGLTIILEFTPKSEFGDCDEKCFVFESVDKRDEAFEKINSGLRNKFIWMQI